MTDRGIGLEFDAHAWLGSHFTYPRPIDNKGDLGYDPWLPWWKHGHRALELPRPWSEWYQLRDLRRVSAANWGAGIYMFRSTRWAGEQQLGPVLYVGQAEHLSQRLGDYASGSYRCRPVAYVIDRAYREQGVPLPSGFTTQQRALNKELAGIHLAFRCVNVPRKDLRMWEKRVIRDVESSPGGTYLLNVHHRTR